MFRKPRDKEWESAGIGSTLNKEYHRAMMDSLRFNESSHPWPKREEIAEYHRFLQGDPSEAERINQIYRGRNNPDGSTVVIAMLIGIGFWYAMDNNLLNFKQGASTGAKTAVGGYNDVAGGKGATPGSSIGVVPATGDITPPGVGYRQFQDIFNKGSNVNMNMFKLDNSNVKYIAGVPNAILSGTMAGPLGAGVVGETVHFYDASNGIEFASTVTGQDGKFELDRPIQKDEINGYYVFAYYPGKAPTMGISLPGISLQPSVSQIISIGATPIGAIGVVPAKNTRLLEYHY